MLVHIRVFCAFIRKENVGVYIYMNKCIYTLCVSIYTPKVFVYVSGQREGIHSRTTYIQAHIYVQTFSVCTNVNKVCMYISIDVYIDICIDV